MRASKSSTATATTSTRRKPSAAPPRYCASCASCDRMVGLLHRRPLIFGVLLGVTQAIALRSGAFREFPTALSLAFLVFGPVAIGYLSVLPLLAPSRKQQIFVPWLAFFVVCVSFVALLLEGVICMLIVLPLVLPLASLGGILAANRSKRSAVTPVVVILPFALAPFEAQIPLYTEIREVSTSIVVAAPAGTVWKHVASVEEITPEERSWHAVFALGFPHPLSAELHEGPDGRSRRARFEGGIELAERISTWDPPRALEFDIDVDPSTIPAETLDAHVTIGGPYFDLLQ